MALSVIVFGGINIVCDKPAAVVGWLQKEVLQTSRSCSIKGISAIELCLSYLSKKRRKELEAVSLYYPNSNFLASVLSFLIKKKVERHVSGGLLIDFLNKVHQNEKSAVFMGVNFAYQRYFTQSLRRMIPGLDIKGFIKSDVIETRGQDTTILLEKAKPSLVYLAQDVKNKDRWLKMAKGKGAPFRLLFIGASELQIFSGKKKPMRPFFDNSSREWIYWLLKKPWYLLRVFLYGFFLIKILNIKLRDRFTYKELAAFSI